MDFNNMKDFGFEDLNVRKSVFDMQVITLDTPYLGGLPPELEKFHYYFSHEGHVLMVIPRNYLKIALESGDLDDYEIQIPVKYVLEKGYEFVQFFGQLSGHKSITSKTNLNPCFFLRITRPLTSEFGGTKQYTKSGFLFSIKYRIFLVKHQ